MQEKTASDILASTMRGLIPDQVLRGKVKLVDKPKKICTVLLDNGLEIPKIRLVPNSETDSDCIVFPKLDTDCLVGLINEGQNTKYYLIAANELESIEYFGAQLGGLVKIQDLVTKINNLENLLNTVLTVFNAHIHTDPVSGVTTTPTVPISNPPIIPTQVTEIEDPKIKH